jgi:hypothetical protein
MSVTQFPTSRRVRRSGTTDGVDSGGGPPHDGDMEERVKKLEGMAEKTVDRLATLERDIAVIRSNYVTKEDLHREISAQTWKLVTFVCGFGTALVAATYFLATHVKLG